MNGSHLEILVVISYFIFSVEIFNLKGKTKVRKIL